MTIAYFFGPRLATISEGAFTATAAEAFDVQQAGALSLENGRWPIIGRVAPWDREEWPVPPFGRRVPLPQGQCWRVWYDEALSQTTVHLETISLEEWQSLPRDSLGGDGAVEYQVSALLGPAELDHPGGPIEHARKLDLPALVRAGRARAAGMKPSPPLPSSAAEDEPDHLRIEVRLADDGFGSDADQQLVDALTDQLTAALERTGTGEFDGHEIGTGWLTLYLYGPDVDAMFEAVRLILRGAALRPGSFAELHHRRPGPHRGQILKTGLS